LRSSCCYAPLLPRRGPPIMMWLPLAMAQAWTYFQKYLVGLSRVKQRVALKAWTPQHQGCGAPRQVKPAAGIHV